MEFQVGVFEGIDGVEFCGGFGAGSCFILGDMFSNEHGGLGGGCCGGGSYFLSKGIAGNNSDGSDGK